MIVIERKKAKPPRILRRIWGFVGPECLHNGRGEGRRGRGDGREGSNWREKEMGLGFGGGKFGGMEDGALSRGRYIYRCGHEPHRTDLGVTFYTSMSPTDQVSASSFLWRSLPVCLMSPTAPTAIQGEGEDPLGVGFVRWGDLYALEVVSPRLAHITSNRARSSVMSSSRVQEPLDECRDYKPGGEAKSSLVDSRDWKLLGEAESSLVDSRDWKPLGEAESSLVNSEAESSLVDSRNWKPLGKAESSLCRYLDGAQNDRARLEGDVLSLTEATALLKVKLKAEGQNAVAAHKASRRFESSLEKMGRVSYEFRYRVTLERL
ncbi:hypothetical protein GW17_00059036 [Ensete ventricosum]|nr:hypothetical protein GW17_00059036 [Ensete ventricosum]